MLCVFTVEDLLHGLVAHLRGGEALQRHDGGVGPEAQQQLAGLDVTGERRSVERRLAECVHRVHLEAEEVSETHFISYQIYCFSNPV